MENIHNRVIEEAGNLFMRYGIKSVTMDDISRELSISKKTIYQFFKDKDELVSQVAKFFLDKEKKKLDEIESISGNAIEQLHGYSACMKDLFESMNPVVLYDLKKYHQKAWNTYIDFKNKVFYHSIKKTLNNGIREGFFREDINVEVLSILRLEEFQLTFDDSIFSIEKFDLQEVQTQLFNHFVYGIVTEKGFNKLNHYFKNHTLI